MRDQDGCKSPNNSAPGSSWASAGRGDVLGAWGRGPESRQLGVGGPHKGQISEAEVGKELENSRVGMCGEGGSRLEIMGSGLRKEVAASQLSLLVRGV